jgi:hypothetical protein
VRTIYDAGKATELLGLDSCALFHIDRWFPIMKSIS